MVHWLDVVDDRNESSAIGGASRGNVIFRGETPFLVVDEDETINLAHPPSWEINNPAVISAQLEHGIIHAGDVDCFGGKQYRFDGRKWICIDES